MSEPVQEWSSIQEGRTALGLRILITAYLFLGAWALDFTLYFVAAFYFVFKHNIRRSSQQFLRRAYLANGMPPPSVWQSYRHILNFARAASDKITVWLGRYTSDNIHLHGYEVYKEYQDRGEGVFIIASHLGNVDVCRAVGGREKKIPLNVLVHNAHAENFNRLMSKETGSVDTINMMQVQDITPDTAMLLKDKISAGEHIIMTGDRTPVKASVRIETVSFLGHDAPFAQGPFILGGLLDCPVFTMFAIKKRDGYHLYMDEFATTLKAARAERAEHLKHHVRRYVTILEDMARRYPLQWFNFYDYWGTNDK